MPPLLILLSILGLLPYILLGLAALGPHADSAGRMMSAFVAWSAIVLTFIGGVHWGLVLRDTDPAQPFRGVRAGLAVLALIIGWVALMLPIVAPSWLALVVLIVGYVGALVAEHHAGQQNLLPPRFLWARWAFTLVAAAMLITVLTLHLLGQTIVL